MHALCTSYVLGCAVATMHWSSTWRHSLNTWESPPSSAPFWRHKAADYEWQARGLWNTEDTALPEGKLIRCPSRSFKRLLLNFPFLFLTLGFSWFSWNIRMLSSRSSTSISRSASCCSRRRSRASWDFCCRAARVSSSSRDRSSWDRGPRSVTTESNLPLLQSHHRPPWAPLHSAVCSTDSHQLGLKPKPVHRSHLALSGLWL